jgi:DNA-binding winged helix-turn-helix (wHTH) protein
VSSPGELVASEAIQKTLWPDGAFFDFEQGIRKCVKQVRAVLGEEGDDACYV